MKNKNSIPIRSDPMFIKMIKEIQIKRIRNGRDNPLKPTRTRRITLAMTRHKLFPQIKKDIERADLV